MKRRRRIYFTAEQKREIWDRWQRGESMSSIGRGFDRDSSHRWHPASGPQALKVVPDIIGARRDIQGS